MSCRVFISPGDDKSVSPDHAALQPAWLSHVLRPETVKSTELFRSKLYQCIIRFVRTQALWIHGCNDKKYVRKKDLSPQHDSFQFCWSVRSDCNSGPSSPPSGQAICVTREVCLRRNRRRNSRSAQDWKMNIRHEIVFHWIDSLLRSHSFSLRLCQRDIVAAAAHHHHRSPPELTTITSISCHPDDAFFPTTRHDGQSQAPRELMGPRLNLKTCVTRVETNLSRSYHHLESPVPGNPRSGPSIEDKDRHRGAREIRDNHLY